MGEGAPHDSGTVFDRADLLARLGGDESMLRAIAGVFLDDAPHQLRSLRDAVRSADPEAVRFRAHGLKGAAANLSAEPLRRAALALEQAGSSGDVGGISGLFSAVERELERLCECLRNTK